MSVKDYRCFPLSGRPPHREQELKYKLIIVKVMRMKSMEHLATWKKPDIAPHAGSVNWNWIAFCDHLHDDVAPHAGSENWNPKCMRNQGVNYTIAPHAGSVSWNSIIFWKMFARIAPHAGNGNWNDVWNYGIMELKMNTDCSPCGERELKKSIIS